MNPNQLIDIEELKIPIRSDRVDVWVNEFLGRFHTNKKSREFIRLKKGVTQELLDEIYPLSKYSTFEYNDPNIFMRSYPGSETSFDADFVGVDGTLIERIEVTMAIDGARSRIQSEAINIFGRSPIYHTPEYRGNSKSRVISEPESQTITSDEIIFEQIGLLNRAYSKKHSNLHKYPNTTLLIAMDIPLFVEWEYSQIMEKFIPLKNTFKKVMCVNISGNQCWRLA